MKTEAEARIFFDNLIFKKFEFNDVWIAGGALRSFFLTGTIDSDVDVYFNCEKKKEEFVKELQEKKFELVLATDTARAFKKDDLLIHVINKIHESYEDLIDTFDLIPACAVITRNTFFCNPRFFECLNNKKIIVHNASSKNILKRIFKYMHKGFSIDQEEIDRIYNITFKDSDEYSPVKQIKNKYALLDYPNYRLDTPPTPYFNFAGQIHMQNQLTQQYKMRRITTNPMTNGTIYNENVPF